MEVEISNAGLMDNIQHRQEWIIQPFTYLIYYVYLYVIEEAYGLPVAQSATSLWSVKSAFTFA